MDVLPLSFFFFLIFSPILLFDKLRQLKRIIIEPNEIIIDFNTRYLELYDQLEIQNKVSLSVIDYENSFKTKVPDLRTSE